MKNHPALPYSERTLPPPLSAIPFFKEASKAGESSFLEYLLERYCVGKSAAFKQYCTLALESVGDLPRNIPALPPHERADFQRAYKILKDHACLAQSLKKQNQARLIFRAWRYVHMALVPLAIIIISYHGVVELLTNVLHLAKI